MEDVSNAVDLASTILILVWCFKVRNRVNAMMGVSKMHPHWFHGFWTFLFEYLYLNYKINCLSRGGPAPAPAETAPQDP